MYVLKMEILPQYKADFYDLLLSYKSSELTKSDSFITPDLKDFFSALTLKFDFLPRKWFVPTVEHLVVLVIFSSQIY